MKYFNGYSMNTCWLEKLTDYVVKHCNCKDFFMPGKIDIHDIRHCNGLTIFVTQTSLSMIFLNGNDYVGVARFLKLLQ